MASFPDRIGRYQIRQRLAQGGMGVLYLGFDPATDRHVALKVLRVDSADLRDRFLHEARLAARLQHPNIITVYDVGSHEGQPFIAMEFIAGETLAQIIGRREPPPIARTVSLVQQICQGLGYAHRHGIVHRDVKPANLMVSGDSGVLKVLDFGVAGRVDHEGQPTMLMGTPNYMSPEQVIGQPVDQRSDIFSVGVVLYELLSCRQAFSGDSQQAVLLKVLHESPEPLTSLVPDLDPAMPAIVDRALEKSVDARYPDLDAMRSDLSRVAQRIEIGEAARLASRRKSERSTERQRSSLRRARHEAALPVRPAPQPLPEPPAPPPPTVDAQAPMHDLLAEAERDAYEGKLANAIRKLEDSGLRHPDIQSAIDRYRAASEGARRGREDDDAAHRLLTDLIRAQVTDVRAAITARRWSEAADLLAALERRLPGTQPGSASTPIGSAMEAPSLMGRNDEVAHYLTRARQRLGAGDVSEALALVEAALDAGAADRSTNGRSVADADAPKAPRSDR